MDEKSVKSDGEIAVKKEYTAPGLTEYGSVAKLTEGGPASVRSDSGTNHMHT